ncbi:Cupin type-1 domain-containing protein [Mycena venus]|uniref:Cupin type-1 domain-containing protein n=1 Tax=Mycena venus TaxID=2733690 RepID=A0A8H6YDN8_9AGAR|nr:Cupin type-1 domain-containing protein [Mycena venus]
MFSKSLAASVLLSTVLRFVPVLGSPLSDEVAQLRLDPTAVDRINTLADDKQFVFDFLNPPAGITKGAAGHTVTATSGTFPAVIGNGVAMTVGFLGPCGINTPHTHPRATEINFSVNGTLRTGMLMENGARFVVNELPPGSMTVFPMGAVHFEMNDNCEPAMFVAAFNGEDPGVMSVAQRFFGLPVDIVAATMGGLGVQEVEGLEAKIPDNIAAGTDACLKRCGLHRPPAQPTAQHQPRVPGNAFPTNTVDAGTSPTQPASVSDNFTNSTGAASASNSTTSATSIASGSNSTDVVPAARSTQAANGLTL